MCTDVPFQVTSFAHELAVHYPNPVVRVFSYQPSQKLTHQLRRVAAFFHPKTRFKSTSWSGGGKLVATPSVGCTQRQLVSGTATPTCEDRNAAVLLCTPLLDQIRDATSFLRCIQQELEYSSLAILCARDRERTPRSSGPSGTEWTPFELRSWLSSLGIPVLFIGHTTATEDDTSRSIIVTILGGRETPSVAVPPAGFQVTAIMSSFNEADIIGPSLDYWLKQGVRVHLLENWSTDDTYRIAAAREARGVHIERFPPEGRGDHYLLGPIFRRKEELAKELEADWFINADVDEVREGPFPGGGIREALYHAERGGFSCVDSTRLDFLPIDESFLPGGDFLSHFRFWEPLGSNIQRKIWKKTPTSVNLTDSGGHDVSFPGRRVYPFHFLLRHYPYRSSEHALRKLLKDRNMDPDEYRVKGWGTHYCTHRRDPRVRRPEHLRQFSSSFYDDYLIERLSAIGFGRTCNAGGEVNS